MNAAPMSLEQHERGIHALWSGAGAPSACSVMTRSWQTGPVKEILRRRDEAEIGADR
jgi:hypothetical protein